MMDRTHKLALTRQCRLLGLSRSTAYYRAGPVSEAELALMRRLDELHLEHPYAGSRMLRDLLRGEGWRIGRKRVRRLMRVMGLGALYRRPRTSVPAPEHKIYPYLLRGLEIKRSNQVWCADISYIPMRRGFLYLFAVMDWHSRKILAWRLSNTLETEFCVEAVREALSHYGTPEIFNTDQGCQFTSQEFTGLLKGHGIAISMDGKGCWRDNVFIERFWRTLKYEEVYLHAYESVPDARDGIGRHIAFYNQHRPHRALAGAAPDTVYYEHLAVHSKAA